MSQTLLDLLDVFHDTSNRLSRMRRRQLEQHWPELHAALWALRPDRPETDGTIQDVTINSIPHLLVHPITYEAIVDLAGKKGTPTVTYWARGHEGGILDPGNVLSPVNATWHIDAVHTDSA